MVTIPLLHNVGAMSGMHTNNVGQLCVSHNSFTLVIEEKKPLNQHFEHREMLKLLNKTQKLFFLKIVGY